jgi:SAM-dependent methyltransferase
MSDIADNIRTYKNLYKSMEHAHAYPNTNLVRLERWFLKKPGKALDHGCGYGENLIFLTTRGYNMVGVDVSEDLIEFVKLKCHMKNVPPTLMDLKVIDEGPLPFSDAEFDYVISLGVLEMMGSKKDARDCLAELGRCLKLGGKMIVSTLATENTFVNKANKVGDEQYKFVGNEADKNVDLEYMLYVPKSPKSFASIFPTDCNIEEIGSWDNNYCNVKGKHHVALVTK